MFSKLEEIFNQLPIMTIGGKDYKPVFRFGTYEQLIADLSLKRKSGERYYPLIYLETPIEEDSETDFKFIFATLNKRTDMRNKDRLKWTFEDVLTPLSKNVAKSLLRSGVFKRNEDTPDRFYGGKKVFNFHVTPDIWDAIIYETSFRYNDDCKVRNIHF